MPEIITINPDHPEQDLIDRAVTILKEGGVIAYPTETFYGLGADAANEAAIEKIFTIKGRPSNNPVALIAGREEDIWPLVAEIPSAAQRLMKAFWPGPLTLILPASLAVHSRLTAGTGTIGIRISSHPIASALARTLGGPITATSANISGREECMTADRVLKTLGGKLNAIIDGGPTMGGKGSTIVDMTAEPPAILREGTVPLSLLSSVLNG